MAKRLTVLVIVAIVSLMAAVPAFAQGPTTTWRTAGTTQRCVGSWCVTHHEWENMGGPGPNRWVDTTVDTPYGSRSFSRGLPNEPSAPPGQLEINIQYNLHSREGNPGITIRGPRQ